MLTLLLGAIFFLPTSIFAQELNEDQTVEGSAFDSMEDLVSEFDEELNESDLEQAIQADSDEKTEEPEQKSAPQNESETEREMNEANQVQNGDNPAEEQVEATSEVTKTVVSKAKAKFNALLVLKSKQRVKIRINKRYRGMMAAGTTRAFPVRAGKVVVTAKTKNKVRRYVKQIKAKTKTTAIIDLSGSKRARVKKNGKRFVKQRVKKKAKKAIKRATKQSVKRATKRARKKKRNK